MRYLFGFLCVCALGLMPLVGCGEEGPECVKPPMPRRKYLHRRSLQRLRWAVLLFADRLPNNAPASSQRLSRRLHKF